MEVSGGFCQWACATSRAHGNMDCTGELAIAPLQRAFNFEWPRAAEFGADNIRVNCIAPGLIKTDFAKALWDNPETLKRALTGTPLKRIGDPEEIAGAAVYLASKAGAYMTGQMLVVDGGATVT